MVHPNVIANDGYNRRGDEEREAYPLAKSTECHCWRFRNKVSTAGAFARISSGNPARAMKVSISQASDRGLGCNGWFYPLFRLVELYASMNSPTATFRKECSRIAIGRVAGILSRPLASGPVVLDGIDCSSCSLPDGLRRIKLSQSL